MDTQILFGGLGAVAHLEMTHRRLPIYSKSHSTIVSIFSKQYVSPLRIGRQRDVFWLHLRILFLRRVVMGLLDIDWVTDDGLNLSDTSNIKGFCDSV